MTTGMGVKVDRHETRISTLINSDGWELGDIHFQLGRDGNRKGGIRGNLAFTSPSGSVSAGSWYLVAAIWDFESRNVVFYCDGVPLEARSAPLAHRSSRV